MFSGIFQPLHLIVILGIVLIVFGPGKLPELGGSIGKGIRDFRDQKNRAIVNYDVWKKLTCSLPI